ncbi:MAG: ATP-dependent Clp protease ATP-binding subunit [Treponema sp.]|nr:ATP-dependent Clp protease ATP-binding subunit [Treponema sp.]
MKKLSTRASRLIYALSQDEARKTKSSQVLPEHLILAMIKSGDGLGFETLKKLRLNVLTFQLALETALKKLSDHLLSDVIEIPESRRFVTLMDLAALESAALQNDYIGTEHLMLASIRESESEIARYFETASLPISRVRESVREIQSNKNSSYYEKVSKDVAANTISNLFGKDSLSEFASFLKNSHESEEKTPDGEKASYQKEPSFIAEFTRDITNLARENKIDPVVGREKEIKRLIQVLSRRTKNNPVLVGDPGVGKTAVVEGLAWYIAKGNVPCGLLKKKLLSLDLAALIAGTKYRGEFEDRMKKMMKEVREDGNIILFIDELHTLIGAGGPEGQMDASNMLKPALSRGEIQIIGASTTKEYSRYIEKDSALERRFQKIMVEEPSDEDCIDILNGIKSQYEKFHGIIYEEEVIPLIVKLSRRYIPERSLPDKAIDILDEAGAEKKILEENKPHELVELEEKISSLAEEKKKLVSMQLYENAALVRDKVVNLKRQFELIEKRWADSSDFKKEHVSTHDICTIISEMTGIPVAQLDTAETTRLVHMEDEMHETVIGQNEAVHLISGAIRRSRAGISSPKHPIGSFIFLGPTGVGKTQLAKALAKFLFGSEDLLVRIDMSDYMEKHNASRLVGAPPGYVGYEDGGVLTEQIRRHPYSVVLLDEIEKAHPDVFNLLLQLLEEGELSDNQGHTVNFRNTVIIMTSNAGARQINFDGKVGFNTSNQDILPYEEIRSNAMNELKKLLSPELINRIDDIIVFEPLSKKQISKILDIQIAELSKRLAEKGITIKLSAKARDYLIENGYEASMGARPMRRLIQREIEDPMSIAILERTDPSMTEISVDYARGALKVHFSQMNIKITAQISEQEVVRQTVK